MLATSEVSLKDRSVATSRTMPVAFRSRTGVHWNSGTRVFSELPFFGPLSVGGTEQDGALKTSGRKMVVVVWGDAELDVAGEAMVTVRIRVIPAATARIVARAALIMITPDNGTRTALSSPNPR